MAEYNNRADDNMAFNAMKNSTTSKADSLMGRDWVKILSDRNMGLGDFQNLYKKRWGDLDKESYGQVESLFNPEHYKYLESENFPPEIIDASLKDAEMYMDEMRSGIDLRESRADEFKGRPFGGGVLGALANRKTAGLKGFFQRLLPGGKSGYGE
tara:strand:+ start:59 stop:523 length:465 start_codon:yes stop_codon:yes gene_type:complete